MSCYHINCPTFCTCLVCLEHAWRIVALQLDCYHSQMHEGFLKITQVKRQIGDAVLEMQYWAAFNILVWDK